MSVGDLDKMVEHVNGRITATAEASAKPKAKQADTTQETEESMSPAEAVASRLGAGRVRAPRKDTRTSAAAQLANRLRGL